MEKLAQAVVPFRLEEIIRVCGPGILSARAAMRPECADSVKNRFGNSRMISYDME